ncbi:hypothetical protein Trisim1_009097 [Trichoderma cf. simile WF8]
MHRATRGQAPNSGVFACCLFIDVFAVDMRARVGDAQMNNARPMEYMHTDVYKHRRYMYPAAFGASSDRCSAEATDPLASSKFCAATIQMRHHI